MIKSKGILLDLLIPTHSAPRKDNKILKQTLIHSGVDLLGDQQLGINVKDKVLGQNRQYRMRAKLCLSFLAGLASGVTF